MSTLHSPGLLAKLIKLHSDVCERLVDAEFEVQENEDVLASLKSRVDELVAQGKANTNDYAKAADKMRHTMRERARYVAAKRGYGLMLERVLLVMNEFSRDLSDEFSVNVAADTIRSELERVPSDDGQLEMPTV